LRWIKLEEDKYLWKKIDVQVKKVDGCPHSNIHKRSNVTTMKSTYISHISHISPISKSPKDPNSGIRADGSE